MVLISRRWMNKEIRHLCLLQRVVIQMLYDFFCELEW